MWAQCFRNLKKTTEPMLFFLFFFLVSYKALLGSPGGWVVKTLLPMQETREMLVLSLGWAIPGGENGNIFQYSCLENPMDRGLRQATVHKTVKSQTQLSTHTKALLSTPPLCLPFTHHSPRLLNLLPLWFQDHMAHPTQ